LATSRLAASGDGFIDELSCDAVTLVGGNNSEVVDAELRGAVNVMLDQRLGLADQHIINDCGDEQIRFAADVSLDEITIEVVIEHLDRCASEQHQVRDVIPRMSAR
jgi:hypothetical protein